MAATAITPTTSTDSAASLLRRGLVWLAALTDVGIVIELATARHWTQAVQFVAWGATALLAVAIGLLARRPTAARVRIAQALAVVVLVSSLLGVWEHIEGNYASGELNRRYAQTWATTPETTRWWLAISQQVGPSPPLAAGALTQAGLVVLLATLRHPMLRTRGTTPIRERDEDTATT